jgi:hypothetical protein
MHMKLQTYMMTHTAADGTVTELKASLGGDADARNWARMVLEQNGGKVSIRLQDGTLFTCP